MSGIRRSATSVELREIRLIHIAKHQLGMDDDTYRAMLWSIGRVRSSKDLDFAGRKRVLDHMKARGFKHRKPTAQDPQSRKIRALWLDLKALGALNDPSERALSAYVANITGKPLKWISSDEASRVIEHLKQWKSRVEKINGGRR